MLKKVNTSKRIYIYVDFYFVFVFYPLLLLDVCAQKPTNAEYYNITQIKIQIRLLWKNSRFVAVQCVRGARVHILLFLNHIIIPYLFVQAIHNAYKHLIGEGDSKPTPQHYQHHQHHHQQQEYYQQEQEYDDTDEDYTEYSNQERRDRDYSSHAQHGADDYFDHFEFLFRYHFGMEQSFFRNYMLYIYFNFNYYYFVYYFSYLNDVIYVVLSFT